MHDGTVGASADGNSVSASQIEKAVTQINSTATSGNQQQVTAADVIPFIVLAPEFEQLAAKYGVGVTNAQISKVFPKLDLAPATLDAYRSNYVYTQLRNSGDQKKAEAAANLIENTKINVNPRFGSVEKGQAAGRAANWITHLPVNPAEQGLPGMHPAG